MKTIVIAGGGRRVGKTTLAHALGDLLPDSRVIKIGEHPSRDGKNPLYFLLGAGFAEVARSIGPCGFLVVESGKILDDPELDPDLVIFLPAGEGREDKPGSERRRVRADIVRGERLTVEGEEVLRHRLELDRETFTSLLAAVDSGP